jgi:hypothetical protein
MTPSLPPLSEVRRWLDFLKESGYALDIRLRASEWATPFVIANDVYDTDPPALSDALFLLCSADIDDEAKTFVYGPEDFKAVRAQLGSDR